MPTRTPSDEFRDRFNLRLSEATRARLDRLYNRWLLTPEGTNRDRTYFVRWLLERAMDAAEREPWASPDAAVERPPHSPGPGRGRPRR